MKKAKQKLIQLYDDAGYCYLFKYKGNSEFNLIVELFDSAVATAKLTEDYLWEDLIKATQAAGFTYKNTLTSNEEW